MQRAVEGLAGDLLLAQGHGKANGWVFRSLRPASFTGEAVGYRAFTQVSERLTALGFVERKDGFQMWMDGFDEGGPKLPYRKYATRFKATPKLLELSARCGVATAQAKDHFLLELPARPLQCRTSTIRAYGEKVKSRSMKFTHTADTKALEDDVRELNMFFDQFELRGGTHRGFVRIFNQGDDPDFDWNKGGRLYSQGDGNYQQMSKERRLLMTIAGEPVCEIDIRASYLTIYHAWFDKQLDLSGDPYALPGLSPDARDIVKLWFVATFGNDKHLTKWPSDIVSDYRERTDQELPKVYPIKVIRDQAIQAYPLLAHWGEREGGWADLMYQESVAVVSTMLDLMRDHGVPSLSVHDSLIVPASKRQVAEKQLAARYRWATQMEPKLVVMGAMEHSQP
jgi:hypothetical protein